MKYSSSLWYHHSQSSRKGSPKPKTFIPSFDIFFGIIYSAYRNHPLPVYIIRPGTPYTSILLSLPLEGLEPTSGCVQKNRGWRKRKKGAKKAVGEEETPGWINGRNIKRRGEGGEENRKKRSITRKAAVVARYRSLAPFASHLTLRIRDMMLEY